MAEHGRAGLRLGLDLEVHLRDDAQRPECADMELHQVITGDVLDDLPARSGDLARGICHRNADDPIADRPVSRTAQAAGIGGDHSANGGAFRMGRIKGQSLPLFAQG